MKAFMRNKSDTVLFFFSKHSVDKIITQWTIFITRSPLAIFLDNPKFHSQTHVNHESNLGHLNPHFTFQLVRSFTITGKKYLNLRRSGPLVRCVFVDFPASPASARCFVIVTAHHVVETPQV